MKVVGTQVMLNQINLATSYLRVSGLVFTSLLISLLMIGCGQDSSEDAAADGAPAPIVELPPIAVEEGYGLPVTLPSGLRWETNDEDPEFASPEAIQGGTFRTYMLTFPLTMRLVGPDSNGSFAGFLRYNNWGPVSYHPITRKPIPALATHWAFGADRLSIFFKINPDAKWSDGTPVTSEDFVFAVQFMRSKQIVAPWYNEYYTSRIKDVRAYDELTFGIQGADIKPREEMLENYAFSAKPKHFHKMSDDWVAQYNWLPEPTTGPYHVAEVRKGKYIDMTRTENWWGNDLKYFRYRFNPSKVRVKVIRDINTAYQHFVKGEIDTFGLVLPQFWHDKAVGEEYDKGYIRKYWLYNRLPVPSIGFQMNTKMPLLDEKEIRLGLSHSMNFQRVIDTILRGDYERLQTFNLGFGEYDNLNIKPRQFDLEKADEHFINAGFVDRNENGIRVRDGEELKFVVSYGAPHHTDRLVVLKEEAKKAGVDLELLLLDGSSAFKRQQEKKHEIAWGGWSSQGFSPRYWEFFHSDNANKTQTNNVTAYSSPAMDILIDSYRTSSDREERIRLAHKLEELVHEAAVFIPSFNVPYTREAAWRWIKVPKAIGTPTTGTIFNSQANSAGSFSSGGLFWIDPVVKEETEAARKEGRAFEPSTLINTDYRT